jgi:hypothetical protein
MLLLSSYHAIHQNSIATADSNLRDRYDHRPLIKRIVDFSISIFRQIQYSLTVLYHRLFFQILSLVANK